MHSISHPIKGGCILGILALCGFASIQANEDGMLSSLAKPFQSMDSEAEENSAYSVDFTLSHDYQPYGPLIYREWENLEDKHTRFTFAPLFSFDRNDDLESLEMDGLYPFWGIDHYGKEGRVQLLQILNWTSGKNADDQVTRRYSFFPLLFIQKSDIPDNDYWGVMPFYGRIRNRMWKDEMNFVMFPFYLESRKKDVVTKNYLFPFFHTRTGNNLNGWQLWPFVGQEHKEVSTLEDMWGDPVLSPGHTKEFYLWPIGLHQTRGIGTPNPEDFLGIIPFYAQTRSPNRDHSVILWPFFNWVDDREKKYKEWGMPYPFFVFARGEGKTTDRVFPFYSLTYNDTQSSSFILWPVWKKTNYDNKDIMRQRDRVLFYLYSDVNEKYASTKQEYRRTDLWPLFSAKLSTDKTYKVNMLSPFEPFFHNNKSIERNWTPAFSLWNLEENKDRKELKESLFWNLYRHEEKPKQKRWSILFGLAEHIQDEEYGTYWRIFYSPDKRRTAEARKQAELEKKKNASTEASNEQQQTKKP